MSDELVEVMKHRSDFTVELVDSMGDDLRVARAAWVSTNSDNRTSGVERIIKYMLRHGHWSPFAHVMFTLRSEVPIFLARQIMRHQSHQFNELSLRYSEAIPHFYMPESLHYQSGSMKQGRAEPLDEAMQAELLEGRKRVLEEAWGQYQLELQRGVAREQARDNLPVTVYTALYTTLSLRSLLHFVGERSDATAQSEARVYARQVRAAVEGVVPITLRAWDELRGVNHE